MSISSAPFVRAQRGRVASPVVCNRILTSCVRLPLIDLHSLREILVLHRFEVHQKIVPSSRRQYLIT